MVISIGKFAEIAPSFKYKRLAAQLVAATVAAGALSGCGSSGPPIGEVAVKVARGFTVPAFIVEKDKWFSTEPERFTAKENGNPTVVRRAPGNYRLQIDRDGHLSSACSFEVKQNRVVTITLKAVGRDIKCDIVS